jgi:hypothetical protein
MFIACPAMLCSLMCSFHSVLVEFYMVCGLLREECTVRGRSLCLLRMNTTTTSTNGTRQERGHNKLTHSSYRSRQTTMCLRRSMFVKFYQRAQVTAPTVRARCPYRALCELPNIVHCINTGKKRYDLWFTNQFSLYFSPHAASNIVGIQT